MQVLLLRSMRTEQANARKAPRRRGLNSELEDGVGLRLREERERQTVSLREFARRLGLSASALSQIETGRSRPSVGTLYAITSELGLTLDEIFTASPDDPDDKTGPRKAESPARAKERRRVQRAQKRKSLELESGVRWERLLPTAEPDMDFLFITYELGGASSRDGTYMRHSGREFGVLLSGRVRVTIGFDEQYELGAGDSIRFESAEPHRIENIGDEPASAIWFVLGRGASDSRKPELDGPEQGGIHFGQY
jgi:transcriptional regulator with XRE-family HTH domain